MSQGATEQPLEEAPAGAHAAFVDVRDALALLKVAPARPFDCMLEAKEKDGALLKLREELSDHGITEAHLADGSAERASRLRCITHCVWRVVTRNERGEPWRQRLRKDYAHAESATLQMMDNRHVSLFNGRWAPTCLILGAPTSS